MGSPSFQVLEEYLAVRKAEGRPAGMRLVHPDMVARIPPSLPWGGELRGRDAFDKLGDAVRGQISVDGSTGKVSTHDAGDYAIVKFVGTATALATGKSFPYSTAEFYTAADGLITEVEMFYGDTAAMLEALATS